MITIDDVTVEYAQARGEAFRAVSEVSLTIEDGEFVCLLGPSGCGKTTLLKTIGGLIAPTAGSVTVDGKVVTGPGSERALVFQEPRLLPWQTVLQNTTFGLELRKAPRKEREAKGRDMLARVGLERFESAFPGELSGGMKQRVGLARALCVSPETLLMDEPFGSVDALTRQVLQEDLLRIWNTEGKTVVFVTHSIDEAVLLADRIVVMTAHPGQIVDVIENSVPRPRTEEARASEEFRSLGYRIWMLLRSNMRSPSDLEVV